jgi:hypothetical protein
MPAKSNNDLKKILHFFKEHSDAISSNQEVAKEYLKSQGKDPDAFANELLKKIKKTQLQVNAKNNEETFGKLNSLKEQAILKAKEIFNSPGFSFLDFMKKEQFSLQNRNLENLSDEEMQNILENYILLKMQKDTQENNDQ